MTTRVIFCLSYDLSKWLFIAFKVDIFSTKNALLSHVVMMLLDPAKSVNIQLLTIMLLSMTWYPPEDTNIDRGDSRGQYWYSMVDINIISNITTANNCFIIFYELLETGTFYIANTFIVTLIN